MKLINTFLFEADQLELDTDTLTPALILVSQVQKSARYRGQIVGNDGSKKAFSLVVVPSPAEPSAHVDVSAEWPTPPTFTIAESGYVVMSVDHGAGGQTITILNDLGVLFDNKHLQKGQTVALRLLRPGKHVILEKSGGGKCHLTIEYPDPKVPLKKDPIRLKVDKVDKDTTKITPDQVTASVAQPIVITLEDGSHIVTSLDATTDRQGDKFVTVLAKRSFQGR